MTFANLCRLVALAAIWGASFLFVRLAVPSLGALWLTELRVGIAALHFSDVRQPHVPVADGEVQGE